MDIKMLADFGANTAEGLARCMGNEEFYLRLVGMAIEDNNFNKLDEAIKNNDFDSAFSAAHALKGILGNLSLSPIYDPVVEITEHLRAREDINYSSLMDIINNERKKLQVIIGE